MLDVAIIGGGLSGLAAAVKISMTGAKSAIFERSPHLGGRCYSFRDKKTGDIVDNGQHVISGAYHELFRYLDLIGTRHYLGSGKAMNLAFHHPTKGFARFEIPSLPVPLRLAAGMLGFKLLSFKDRLRLLAVGRELNRLTKGGEERLRPLTVERWLNGLGQSEEARKCFWYPIAVAVMNEQPEKGSAFLFARALRRVLMGEMNDSAILVPRIGQTGLYVDSAEKFLSLRNTAIFRNYRVESISVTGNDVAGIRLCDGSTVRTKYLISTIPFYNLWSIIPDIYKNTEPFAGLINFESSPIISVNLWFEKDFMEMEYLGVIGMKIQWLFKRYGTKAFHICAVISSAHDYITLSNQRLTAAVLDDLRGIFPETGRIKLLRSVVIKERRATFSPTPFVEAYRPSAETPIRNFFLAGDWTDTGFPPTIESAVVSGFRAAAMITGSV